MEFAFIASAAVAVIAIYAFLVMLDAPDQPQEITGTREPVKIEALPDPKKSTITTSWLDKVAAECAQDETRTELDTDFLHRLRDEVGLTAKQRIVEYLSRHESATTETLCLALDIKRDSIRTLLSTLRRNGIIWTIKEALPPFRRRHYLAQNVPTK